MLLRGLECKCENITSESRGDVTCDSLGDVTRSHGTNDVKRSVRKVRRIWMRKQHQQAKPTGSTRLFWCTSRVELVQLSLSLSRSFSLAPLLSPLSLAHALYSAGFAEGALVMHCECCGVGQGKFSPLRYCFRFCELSHWCVDLMY